MPEDLNPAANRMESVDREVPQATGGSPLHSAGEGGKLQRLSGHTKSLIEDVKAWAELKMTLTQIEIEETVDKRVNQAVTGAVVAALAGMAALFALTAAALGIGEWLGHPAWGFLIVAGFLIVITIIVRVMKPRVVDVTGNSILREDS